jgi:uncharacterized phage protein gp47/JayE
MPADFTEYVDLSIFDKEPGDIYRDAIELARLSLPDFNLRVGTPEDAIFQAAAYVSALNINAINRLPDRLMAGIVSMLGYQRQEAIPAEVDIEITLGSYEGGTIPAGTAFVYDSVFEDEFQQYAFQLTSSLTIPSTIGPAYPSGIATVTAIEAGVIPPLTAGTELAVISSGTDIISAVVATESNFANGINADIDTEYLSKATTYMRSLASALARPTQVDSYLLTNYPGIITRAKTFDLTNGNTDSGNITNKRTSGVIKTFLNTNLATIETEAPHLFIVGDVVELDIFNSSVSATFNGEHTITQSSDTTFSFVKVAGNSASTVVTGSAYAGQDVSGYVTVVAYGNNTELTSPQKIGILSEVRAKSVAGLSIELLDPTLVTLEISGSITLNEQYEQTALRQAIEDALVEFLSPASFSFNFDRIRQSQIIALISNIPGVIYVESLTLIPTGNGWLPKHDNDILFRDKGSLPILSLDDIDFTYTAISAEG